MSLVVQFIIDCERVFTVAVIIQDKHDAMSRSVMIRHMTATIGAQTLQPIRCVVAV